MKMEKILSMRFFFIVQKYIVIVPVDLQWHRSISVCFIDKPLLMKMVYKSIAMLLNDKLSVYW